MNDHDKTKDQLIEELKEMRYQLSELQLAQESKHDCEKNFQALLDGIPESVFIMKPDGELLTVNKTFLARIGVTEQDVVGKNVYDFISSDVAKRRKAWIENVINTFLPLEVIDDRDGMLMRHHIYPVMSDDGRVDRLAIYANDINDLRTAEIDLANITRNYSLLFRIMIEGVAYCKVIYDDGKPCDIMYVEVNDSFEKLTGLKNIVGKRGSEQIPQIPELHSNLLEIYGHVVSSGKPIKAETFIESMKIWFHISVYVLDEETFIAVFDNITDKKIAERELHKNEEKFRNLIETSNRGIWSIDKDRRTTLVNRKMADMIGYTEDEMIGVPVTKFIFEEDLADHHRRMECLERAENGFYERRLRHKNGHAVETLVSATALVSENREFLGSFGMLMDISDMNKTLEALIESEQRYKAVVDNIEIGISILNPNLEIIEVNKFFHNYFPHVKPGCSQICYEQYNDPPRSAPCAYCPCVLTLKDGKVHEAITETPSGSEIRHYRLVSSPIMDAAGNVAYVIELTQDITESIRASEKLRLEKDKFKSIMDSMNAGVYIVGQDYDIEYVNPVLEANFGNPSGSKCFEYFHKLKEPCPWCKNSAVFGGKTAQWEWTSPKTGKTYDLFETPIKNEDGTISKLEILHDVTNRKKTEEELRQSQERLRLKLDSILKFESDLTDEELSNILDRDNIQDLIDDFNKLTGVGVSILDLTGNILIGGKSQGASATFDWKNPLRLAIGHEMDLLQKQILESGAIISFKSGTNFNNVMSPLLIGKKHVGYIYMGQFLYEDEDVDAGQFESQADSFGLDQNEYLDMLNRMARMSRQRVNTVMDFLLKFTTLVSKLSHSNLQLARSVSKQKEIEEELRESQEDLRLIVEKSPIILLTSVGIDQRTTYVNPKFYEFLGYSPSELGSILDWWPQAYPDEVYRDEVMREWNSRIDMAVANKSTINPLEVKVRCKDGSEKIIEWGFVSTGAKTVIFGVDLTQRKLAEREKESLQERLLQSQKMEAIGTLAGGIAHDFNNLLQVVIGYIELLNDDVNFPSDYKTDLKKVSRAALDGAELVKGLLMFGRKTVPKMVPVNLNQLITRIRKLLDRTIPKMIGIELKLEEDISIINADKTQMEQVLLNLAVNARDAMPSGGKLFIETSMMVLDEKSLPNQLGVKQGPYVRLRVADTGVGIEKDLISRIFEPFFTTKDIGKGTGLGLSVVYGIIQQHSGYMTCSSELNQGTAFEVFLPTLEVGKVETLPSDEPQTVPPGGRETILLVDDDEGIRTLTGKVLVSAGYEVVQAVDGEEALTLFTNLMGKIDLVILDLIMPKMGGLMCLEKLMQIKPDTPVIVASGYAEEGSENQLVKMGAKSCVTKPYSQTHLLKIIRSILDNQI